MGFEEATWVLNELSEIVARCTGFYTEQTEYEWAEPGTYDLMIPYNCTKIVVTACGGGGGGAGTYSEDESTYAGAGGSGGEAIADKVFDVPNAIRTKVIVGAGGTGGGLASSDAVATNGEDTVIGDIVTLKGGLAGGLSTGENTPSVGVGSGYGGTGYAGSSVSAVDGGKGITGAGGKKGGSHSGYYPGGGGGGSLGAGGNGGTYYGNEATSGTLGGGGGGACQQWNCSYHEGGNGGNGYCKITLILN